MNIECAAIGNGTVQLGRRRIESTTERLLPGEVAPVLERSRYVIGSERFTCFKLTGFGRRLIVELVRPVR
jgi:hypothetical protein